MIFSREEYKDAVKFVPIQQIGRMRKGHDIQLGSLHIFSSMIEYKVNMYICYIIEEYSNFRLIAGPDDNSVIVVTSLDRFQPFIPYELVTNISINYIDFQVRLPSMVKNKRHN